MGRKRNPPREPAPRSLPTRPARDAPTVVITSQKVFDVVLGLIAAALARAFAAVNTTVIDLYWQIGEHISQRVATNRWGGANRRGPGRIHPEAPAKRELIASIQARACPPGAGLITAL